MNMFERPLDHPELQRYSRVSHIYIEYPRFARILRAVEECFTLSQYSAEPLCLMIIGDSGVGKSYLTRRFMQNHSAIMTAEGYEIPVLYVSMKLPGTIKGALTELLKVLKYVSPGKGTADDKRLIVLSLLKKFKVRMVIIDEFQHMLKSGNRDQITEIAEWFKSMINATGIPWVLVGMPEGQMLLEYSEQLRRRFLRKLKLEPFDFVQSPEEFRSLVKLYERDLEFPKPSGLAETPMLGRLYLASDGYFGRLTMVLNHAVRYALSIKAARLEHELITLAFGETMSSSWKGRANPFLLSEKEIEAEFSTLRKACAENA